MFATVSIKKLHGLTSRKCNTRSRALGSLPAKGALNSDQAISLRTRDGECERTSWSGPKIVKLQARINKHQAGRFKLQAFEPTCSINKLQASQPYPQASSFKPEVTSSLIREPRYMDIGEVLEDKGPRAFAKIKVLCGCLI